MRKNRSVFACLLAFLLCLSCVSPAFAAGDDAFTISDPYAGIDWTAVHAYKTALHTHTNASDGDHTLKESLQRHAEAGFDIVAVSDHGTVDYGWETAAPNGPFFQERTPLL